jgi:hypothetical protein
LGNSFTRPRASGNSLASKAGRRFAQDVLAILERLGQQHELR